MSQRRISFTELIPKISKMRKEKEKKSVIFFILTLFFFVFLKEKSARKRGGGEEEEGEGFHFGSQSDSGRKTFCFLENR